MEFKQLDIKPEGNWFKRTFWSQHGKKTTIYIILGAIAGLVFFIFSEEKQLADISSAELVKNMLMGGFFGFFMTNNPCARNKC